MMFKGPRPVEKVEELAARGVERILYFRAATSADSLSSGVHVPEMIAKARVPARVEFVNLEAWDDHDLTIEAIFERVEPLLASEAPPLPGFRSVCGAAKPDSSTEPLATEES